MFLQEIVLLEKNGTGRSQIWFIQLINV